MAINTFQQWTGELQQLRGNLESGRNLYSKGKICTSIFKILNSITEPQKEWTSGAEVDREALGSLLKEAELTIETLEQNPAVVNRGVENKTSAAAINDISRAIVFIRRRCNIPQKKEDSLGNGVHQVGTHN